MRLKSLVGFLVLLALFFTGQRVQAQVSLCASLPRVATDTQRPQVWSAPSPVLRLATLTSSLWPELVATLAPSWTAPKGFPLLSKSTQRTVALGRPWQQTSGTQAPTRAPPASSAIPQFSSL